MSYKTIFALAAAYNQELEQIDVKTAFFYGDIKENIQIELLIGYSITSTTKLNKALYSLKQSSLVWYNTLANFLVTLGFQPLDTDASVFTKESIIIAIYMDDLLIAGDSKTNISTLKSTLSVRRVESSQILSY